MNDTTKEIIKAINTLKEIEDEPSSNILLSNFPFFINVNEAFEELKIDAEAYYAQTHGVDSEFDIPFRIDGIQYSISGTVRYGYAHVNKFLENDA